MVIKELRKVAGLSQKALAKATNVNRVSISRYETGERVPTLNVAAKIAQALDCKIDDLVSGNKPTK